MREDDGENQLAADRPAPSSAFGWALALLIPPLLFVALHARSIDYEFVWTDQGEIENGLLIRPPGSILGVFGEPTLQSLDRLAPGSAPPYYRPLQVVVISSIDHQLGRRPAYFRAVNLALGAITLVLFAVLLGVLFGDPLLAGLAAAVVAVHPAGIENHVWIAGMPSSFVMLFRVLGLISVPMALRASSLSGRTGWVGLGLLALLLGLASKEDALVTPGLALVCAASIWTIERRGPDAPGDNAGRAFWPTAAFIVVAQLVVCLLYLFWWRPAVLGGSFTGSAPAGGSLPVHILTVLATWPERLAWLVLPVHSTTSDVVPLVTSLRQPLAWLGGLMGLAAPLLWLRLLYVGRPALALGWAWMVLGFLPASGLVPLTHLRAERYLAPAVFGLALIFAAPLSDWLPRPRWLRRSRDLARSGGRSILAVALTLALLVGLAHRTWARVPDWRSDIVLFERDVRRDPLFREGYYVLANALAEEGRHSEAKLWLERLIEVDLGFGARWSFLSRLRVLELICDVNVTLGTGADTLPLFADGLRPDAPDLARLPGLYRCGARSLEQAGRAEDALEIYHALRAQPGWRRHPELMLDVARSHALNGDLEMARSWLGQVPRKPRFTEQIRVVEAILAEQGEEDAEAR